MSTTTLHKRKLHSHTNMNNNQQFSNTPRSEPNQSYNQHTLTSSVLLRSNPIHHSKIYKLKIPLVYTIVPTVVLNVIHICLFPILKLCNIQIKPFWVERYFIVIGNYLYKFQPNGKGSMGKNDMKLKGSPIDLQTMTVTSQYLSNNGTTIVSSPTNNNHSHSDRIEMYDVPSIPNCHGYFTITTKGMTNHYACETQLEARTWINTLHQARQECITTSMGHSKKPLTKQVEYANMMGKSIVDRKERISSLIRNKEMDEVELMCLNGGGTGTGSLPRGYFG